MSRFAADPRWLIYLPPTLAPVATSRLPGLLEHPDEAFAFYRQEGVARVMCQEKHMGSRAVLVVCRDPQVAPRRFGIQGDGICTTRTGRPFFADARLQAQVLERARTALEAGGLWDALETDWLALDCELMPWSAKAEELLTSQYAPVGASSVAALSASVAALERAAGVGIEVADLVDRERGRLSMARAFVDAYGRYCWPVTGVEGLRIAPFQVLAGEREVHAVRDHLWHLETVGKLAAADGGLFTTTRHVLVDVTEPKSIEAGVRWWESLTAEGGEGMVVKPLDGIVLGRRGMVQPALKVRGREYLRIIYGPEYTAPENLERLRERNLGHKRSMAAREFALGIEALERFVRHEPLHRVHECVFGVLALESEPVDPRL